MSGEMSDLDLKEWAQAIMFTTPRKCECGLEKTYGPDTNLEHSDWCIKYKEPKYSDKLIKNKETKTCS